jgi:hypothetical protein
MARLTLEVADIFRDHGAAWRAVNAGHVSRDQLKVMSAIERCRTAALGGHVARCENSACGHTLIAYNSCANRHCPKCQAGAARDWLADREAELLPVPYFHVVYTLPAELRHVAYQNKAVVYGLLMKAAAETTLEIAADEKHLGARIGITAVLHTWGSAMTHHPHVHMIVPGGGLSADGSRWIAAKPDFLVHVNLLSALFRAKFLAMLADAHVEGRLQFHNQLAGLANSRAFKRFLGPLRHAKWVVYCKPPFAGPEAVLRYLSRYTHRVAISNRRLIAADHGSVSFRWKDYRVDGPERWKTMTLHPHEFIRRFLVHVLPKGFHRIRHYGMFANGNRAEAIARARELLAVAPPPPKEAPASATGVDEPRVLASPCPCCGGRMRIIETFEAGAQPRYRSSTVSAVIGIDTS